MLTCAHPTDSSDGDTRNVKKVDTQIQIATACCVSAVAKHMCEAVQVDKHGDYVMAVSAHA